MHKAILFDLDGTLADSEPIHFQSHKRALATAGIELTFEEYVARGISRHPRDFYNEMAVLQHKKVNFEEIHARKEAFFEELLPTIAVLSPFKKLLPKLKKDFKLGVVTAAPESYALKILHQNGCDDYFDLVLGSESYNGKNKPNPYPYQLAAEKLRVSTSECIAIEDSKSGITSAIAASTFCIALHTQFNKKQDLSNARLHISDVERLSIGFLKAL